MQQYFVNKTCTLQEQLLLEEEQCHHIVTVLRMRTKDRIRIVDLEKHVFLAEIQVEGKVVHAHLIEQLEQEEDACRIRLAPCLIKQEKWEWMLQKTCELGVDQILPVISSRCVVKVKEEQKDKKIVRWNRITQEACEQCRRASLVKVASPISLHQLCQEDAELKLVAYEDADVKGQHIKKILHQHPDASDILCVIGPEGGFAKEEIQMLQEAGFQCISLGKRILRAETASMATICSIRLLQEV